jgi:hypothetical protein
MREVFAEHGFTDAEIERAGEWYVLVASCNRGASGQVQHGSRGNHALLTSAVTAYNQHKARRLERPC